MFQFKFNKSSRVESYQCFISVLINRKLESMKSYVLSKSLSGFLVEQIKQNKSGIICFILEFLQHKYRIRGNIQMWQGTANKNAVGILCKDAVKNRIEIELIMKEG